ncbi:hypothetical protein [Nocardioides massiliensis]|uniref:Uncharacterized protein n=1 Tax=Nocardioides massiliensis TaxID=1325935 RepID=A0ABT9NJ10_9ACTN|nr:hypothetical protein [Nocardioides massiliensis]MDP9820408.1 hypothetical protein [Nocardioides massiliensis]
MSDTTAKIRAKGLNATGITDDMATRFADQESGHLIAVVELEVAAVSKNVTSGDRAVDLVITHIEPATTTLAEDHLREFQRALFYNRKVDDNGDQLPLDGGDEPTVEQVRGHGAALVEHDESGEVIGLWDGRHPDADPDDVDEDQDEDQDPDAEPDEDHGRRAIPDPFNPGA